MEASLAITKLRALQRFQVELVPGGEGKPRKLVNVRRPPQGEWSKFIETDAAGGRSLSCDWRLAASYVEGWEGFTEADILGSALASGEPQPFHVDLWMLVAADRMDYCQAIGEKLIESIVDEHRRREADKGNSAPT